MKGCISKTKVDVQGELKVSFLHIALSEPSSPDEKKKKKARGTNLALSE